MVLEGEEDIFSGLIGYKNGFVFFYIEGKQNEEV